MSRKNFKDSTAHLDQFFSTPLETPVTLEDPAALESTTAPEISVATEGYRRLNLKVTKEIKKYLDQVSWENRKSITKYICDLIQKDKETRGR